MKRLAYPVMLVSISLLAAAMITTILAKTMASFDEPVAGSISEVASVR